MDKLFIGVSRSIAIKGITWKKLCTLVDCAKFVERFFDLLDTVDQKIYKKSAMCNISRR